MNLKDHKEVLDKISNSKTFRKSPTSIALLKYLFEATSENIDLKETTIDIEFFKTDQSNKSPKARVSVYNLRKKLDNYYQAEGKEDKIQLAINKGQYQVSLIKTSKNNAFKQIKTATIFPYLLALVFLTLLLFKTIPKKAPKLWEPFLNNKTTLYIGDAYGLMGKTITGSEGWTRDYNINSIEDYYAYLDEHPEDKGKLLPPKYQYTTRMGVLATQSFQKLFDTYDKDFNIRFSSNSSTSEIKESNGIYVGPLKNNNGLIPFFNGSNPYFTLTDSLLTLEKHPKLKDTAFVFPYQVSDKELAIVSKISGANNKDYLIFFSNHDIGVSACVEFFTNTDSIQKFSEKYLSDKKHFTAIFKTKGKNRTDTSTELLLVTPF